MSVLTSQLNPRSADFQANAAHMQLAVDDLQLQVAKAAAGGGEAARAKHVARGKLLPRERVEMLLDPGQEMVEVELRLFQRANDEGMPGLRTHCELPAIETQKDIARKKGHAFVAVHEGVIDGYA